MEALPLACTAPAAGKPWLGLAPCCSEAEPAWLLGSEGKFLLLLSHCTGPPDSDSPLYLPYKTLVSTVGSMVFNEGEAQRLIEILSEKAGVIQDTWHKVDLPSYSSLRGWQVAVLTWDPSLT